VSDEQLNDRDWHSGALHHVGEGVPQRMKILPSRPHSYQRSVARIRLADMVRTAAVCARGDLSEQVLPGSLEPPIYDVITTRM
jgi:hypothetical protein